tara:strand:+ start:943 stop:1377 length:435 start_codon:yes stop_codon:yes gene_type:complete
MDLLEKSPQREKITFDARKGDKGEIINVYFTIVTRNFVNKINEITDTISEALIRQNVEFVDELTARLEEQTEQFKNSINYLRELNEGYLLLDSTIVGSTSLAVGHAYDPDEFSKMIQQSQVATEERKEKVRKRKTKGNKKKSSS